MALLDSSAMSKAMTHRTTVTKEEDHDSEQNLV